MYKLQSLYTSNITTWEASQGHRPRQHLLQQRVWPGSLTPDVKRTRASNGRTGVRHYKRMSVTRPSSCEMYELEKQHWRAAQQKSLITAAAVPGWMFARTLA